MRGKKIPEDSERAVESEFLASHEEEEEEGEKKGKNRLPRIEEVARRRKNINRLWIRCLIYTHHPFVSLPFCSWNFYTALSSFQSSRYSLCPSFWKPVFQSRIGKGINRIRMKEKRVKNSRMKRLGQGVQ